MLNDKQVKELNELADRQDTISWRLGEIALEAWNHNLATGGKYYKFQVYSAIAREARCSKGRVEKLAVMVQFYPKEIRDNYPNYKLGHFETAMHWGPEEAPEVLEYITTYIEDTGQLPKVNALDYLYRREVKGQETEEEMTGRKVPYNPDLLQEQVIALLKSIRGLLLEKPLSARQKEKLSQGMELIESALIDEKSVIQYN